MNKKFDTIIESYINGNISWVKEEVKKLSKTNRKLLYMYVKDNELWSSVNAHFFFELI